MVLKNADFHSPLVCGCSSEKALIDKVFFIVFCKRVEVLYLESMLWLHAAPWVVEISFSIVARSTSLVVILHKDGLVIDRVHGNVGTWRCTIGTPFPKVFLILLLAKIKDKCLDVNVRSYAIGSWHLFNDRRSSSQQCCYFISLKNQSKLIKYEKRDDFIKSSNHKSTNT